MKAATITRWLSSNKKDVRVTDLFFYWKLKLLAFGVIGLLIALVWRLWDMAHLALQKSPTAFFFGQDWNPVTESFGALPVIFGTVVSSILALLIAVPVSIGVSVFLTEVAPRRIGIVIGFLVEMLAAIPSVVFGLWGIFVLAPFLRSKAEPWLADYFGFLPFFQGPPYGVGMLAAGIVLAIMITPTISSICREVFRAIPNTLREGASALGATKWEVISIAVLKNSVPGIVGAVVLGLGRALGETMAVTMVIGNRAQISASLFDPGQTMASLIANEYAEATGDIHLSALAAVGLGLFVVSLGTNAAAKWVALRIAGQMGK